MNNRRTDKYEAGDTSARSSRVNKYEKLYDEMNNKIGYSEAVDLTSNATLDLNDLANNKKSRENYQQVREVHDLIAPMEPISKEFKKEESLDPKSFDINVILEEAKKNRSEVDELEVKRNLKDSDYNVLTNLNRKYLHKKDVTEEDREELQELIDTITGSSISTEIDSDSKELLSELMTSSIKTDLDNEEEVSESDKEQLGENEEEANTVVASNTFYTKSMEITENDFDVKDEIHSEKKESNTLIIVLVILILLVLTAIISYFVLRHFEISIF